MATRHNGTLVTKQSVTGQRWSITILTVDYDELPGTLEVWRDARGWKYRVLAHVDDEHDLIIEYRSGLTSDEMSRRSRFWKG